MCFSATASFTAAAALATAGLVILPRVRDLRELPLAGVPALFAAQQALEGALWLTLSRPGNTVLAGWLANGFVLFALVIWPVYAPLSALLVESRLRRRLMWLFVGLGALFALYSLADIAAHPYHVVRTPESLCYINNSPYPGFAMALYVPAVCGAFLISSKPLIRTFGAIILLGLAVSLATFFADLVSVWCFFAALASVILTAHFFKHHRLLVNGVDS